MFVIIFNNDPKNKYHNKEKYIMRFLPFNKENWSKFFLDNYSQMIASHYQKYFFKRNSHVQILGERSLHVRVERQSSK